MPYKELGKFQLDLTCHRYAHQLLKFVEVLIFLKRVLVGVAIGTIVLLMLSWRSAEVEYVVGIISEAIFYVFLSEYTVDDTTDEEPSPFVTYLLVERLTILLLVILSALMYCYWTATQATPTDPPKFASRPVRAELIHSDPDMWD